MKHTHLTTLLVAGTFFLFSSAAHSFTLLTSAADEPVVVVVNLTKVVAIAAVRMTAGGERMAHRNAVNDLVSVASERTVNDKSTGKTNKKTRVNR